MTLRVRGWLCSAAAMGLVSAASLFSYPTLAQEAQRTIEEIVVTATKREASIQDIPIAVSAYSGEDLDARGVQDLYGLQEVSPSISVYSSNSTSNGGTIRIRGVGTTGNNPGLEAAVGTFIDGVYRSRAGQAFSDLVDIERIEVLRGPQGTLFGKNTSAGALQIITKRPEFDRDTTVSLSAGDYSAIRVQGSTTGPITETLAYRLAANYHDRDGYYEDNVTNDAYDSRDRWSAKGQLLWLGKNWDNRLMADYAEHDEDCCPAKFLFVNDFEQATSSTTRSPLDAGRPPAVIVNELLADLGRPLVGEIDEDDDEVGVNFEPFEEIEDWGVQNEFNITFGDTVEFKSITAYREFDVERGQDIDFSGADILLPQFTNESFENFSQELQLTWSTERVDWLAGAYFYTEDIVTDESIRLSSQGPDYLSQLIVGALFDDALADLDNPLGAAFGTTRGSAAIGSFDVATGTYVSDGSVRANFALGDGYFADYEQDTKGWSLFTHNTIRVTDRLDVTLGVRYSWEEKDAETRINGVSPVEGTERDLLIAMLNDDFNEDHCNGLVFVGALCNIVSWQDEETEKEWTGTVQVSYALTDDINVYGSYSRGYKAGGFNLDQQAIEMDSFATFLATGGAAEFLSPTGQPEDIPQEVLDATGGTGQNGLTQFACGSQGGVTNPTIDDLDCTFFDDDHRFEPEFVDAFELGMKGTFMEGLLTVNVAAFYSDFEDFQLNTFTGTGFLISNLDEMITRGVEWESTLSLGAGIYWTLGLTYADARYGDSLNRENTSEAELFLEQDFRTLEDWGELEKLEDRQITQAPYWQGSTSLFVEQPVGSNVAYGNLNVGFRGANNTGSNLEEGKDIPDEVLVNLQLGLRAQDGRWDAQLWARNLFDEHVNTLVFNSVFQDESLSTFFAPPRMIGGTLKLNF